METMKFSFNSEESSKFIGTQLTWGTKDIGIRIGWRNAFVQVWCDFTKFVESLGWFEHAGDWDLYTEIEMENGEVHKTCPGYSVPEGFHGTTVSFVMDSDIDDEEISESFEIHKIKSLTLKEA